MHTVILHWSDGTTSIHTPATAALIANSQSGQSRFIVRAE